MNEFEILSAFVRIFEKGVSQTLLRLRHFDQQFSRMQAGWRQVKIDVGVPGLQQVNQQLNQVNNKLNQVKQQTDRVNTSFQTMRTIVAGIRTLVAGVVVGFIARTTFEFEKLNLRLLAFTQNQRVATKLYQDLVKFSGQTFFDIEDLGSAAAQLLNMRVSVESVIPSLRVLNDIAIATGKSISDIAFPLIDIAKKGNASAIDIRQFATRRLDIYTSLSKVTGIWGDELHEAISAGKIGFPEVTEALKLLSKEMDIGSAAQNTSAAKFRVAWNELKLSAIELGKALSPIITAFAFLTKVVHSAVVLIKALPVNIALAFLKTEQGILKVAAAIRAALLLDPIPKGSGAESAKEYIDELISQLDIEHDKVTEQLNAIWAEAGKDSGEAFVQTSSAAIQEGFEEIDIFKDLTTKTKDALAQLRSEVTRIVLAEGPDRAIPVLNTPIPVELPENLRAIFDEATQETLKFVGTWMEIFEQFQPTLGARMAADLATAEVAYQRLTDEATKAGTLFGKLVSDVERSLKPEETRKIEAFGKAFGKAMEEGGISLGATVESFFKKDGPVDQSIEGVTKQVLELFKVAELPTAGGLAGAFKAGSVEALQLRKAGLDFDKRQLETLNRIEANTRKQTEKFDPVDVLVNFIGGGIFQGAG